MPPASAGRFCRGIPGSSEFNAQIPRNFCDSWPAIQERTSRQGRVSPISHYWILAIIAIALRAILVAFLLDTTRLTKPVTSKPQVYQQRRQAMIYRVPINAALPAMPSASFRFCAATFASEVKDTMTSPPNIRGSRAFPARICFTS